MNIKVVVVFFIVAIILWKFTGLSDEYSNPSNAISSAVNAETPKPGIDITDDTFAALASFEKPGVSIERDPKARNTVRIYFTLQPTVSEAREVARTARNVLGERSIVYVKNVAGDTIAKATPWGME